MNSIIQANGQAQASYIANAETTLLGGCLTGAVPAAFTVGGCLPPATAAPTVTPPSSLAKPASPASRTAAPSATASHSKSSASTTTAPPTTTTSPPSHNKRKFGGGIQPIRMYTRRYFFPLQQLKKLILMQLEASLSATLTTTREHP